MKAWKLLWLVLLGYAVTDAATAQPRSANPVLQPTPDAVRGADPNQSAALFVGVSRFAQRETIANVPYAADDAVDLAYALVFGEKGHRLNPALVVLALAGEPVKGESRKHLRALEDLGAKKVSATRENILAALQQQAGLVGNDGLLIVSFASHGFSSAGVAHVLTEESLQNDPQTAISTGDILELAGRAPRSVVFLDACRERIDPPRRATGHKAATGAPLVETLKRFRGQVVFYAAAAGKFAYDDDKKKNGVFTGAVIQGLKGKAKTDERGFITVTTLRDYVDSYVARWVHEQRGVPADGIQTNIDGQTGGMPLVFNSPPLPSHLNPATVQTSGSSVKVFSGIRTQLWQHDVQGNVVDARVEDLNRDGRNEVIVAVGPGGEESGQIVVFEADGESRWTHDTNADGGPVMTIHTLFTGELFRYKKPGIVALSVAQDGSASRITVLDTDGKPSAYIHPGSIRILVDRPTKAHDPRIIGWGADASGGGSIVLLLNPNKMSGQAGPLWQGHTPHDITQVQTEDHNGDGEKDLAVITAAGPVYVDFQGRIVGGGVPFTLGKPAPRQARR